MTETLEGGAVTGSATGPVTSIRPATDADLPTILSVLEGAGLHTGSVTLSGATFWMARQGARPVGTIGLEHGQGVSLLRSAAVLPQARALGVGRALVHSALALATLRGDRAVYLFSSQAGGFWRRFGFEEAAVDELAAALPEVPQVRSGLCTGWLSQERAWRKLLEGRA